jgi:hypothetical protein
MRIAAGGDAAAKAALDRLENCLSAYDYETALNELEQWRQTLDEPKKA